MKRFPFPLRYSVPAILLVLGGVLSLYSFQREVALSNQRNEENASQYAKFSRRSHLQCLGVSLPPNRGKGADLVVNQLGEEADIQAAFLLDENNRIIFTIQQEFQRRLLRETPGQTNSRRSKPFVAAWMDRFELSTINMSMPSIPCR